ncbi:MAG: BamA/TamA family outer membrane protein [Elusimicrobiota bacterium]|jgi:hypothetical protein
MPRRLLLACLLLSFGLTAYSEDGDMGKDYVPQRKYPEEIKVIKDETPLPLRLIMKPIKRGMWIRLPVVDSDPNRGITAGVMPIWVIRDDGTDRIAHIHAPSLTYNKHFGFIPTYRYYYYPASDSSLVTRAAVGEFEHEVLAQYEDHTLYGTNIDFFSRVQWNADSGQRYFGIGPDTAKDAETNFKEDYVQAQFMAGIPFNSETKWRFRVSDRLLSDKVMDGPLAGLPGFQTTYPGLAPTHHLQSHEMRFILDYDSRDHSITTTRGAKLETFAEYSSRDMASAYDFNRYGLDGRYFFPWPGHDDKYVSVAQVRFEQLYGQAPFWLMPRIGGKYALRAYGDGRYIDRGMTTINFEQRCTVYKARMAGVTTEFEIAPFAGLGTVFHTPDRMSKRYARPVIGSAVRAVARPQVVGSIDFGVGQEGLAVFMDINYAF